MFQRTRLMHNSKQTDGVNKFERPRTRNFDASTPTNGTAFKFNGPIINQNHRSADIMSNSPSSISSTPRMAVSQYHSEKYSQENAYEAVYAEKLTVHTIEEIISKSPVQTPVVAGSQIPRNHRWWPWILLPLLLVLPLALFVASDDFRRSACSWIPLPASEAVKRATEFNIIKKYYHYFVPANVTSGKYAGSSSSLDDDIKQLGSLLAAVDLRLQTVENTVKKMNLTSTPGKNLTKDVHDLEVLFSKLDQRIDDLDASSLSKKVETRVIRDEVEAMKQQLAALQRQLGTLKEGRKGWHEQLNQLISQAERQQKDLSDVTTRLASLSNADCNCPSALLPSGGISREDVDRLIIEAINRYDADKTGLPDYALEPAGGAVVSTRCTETYATNTRQHTIFGIPIPLLPRDYTPRVVIQPGLVPGECWAFAGPGYLVIRLSGLIRVTAVSYEHIPKEISPDGNIHSAPKNMEILALSTELDKNGTSLGTFTYDANGPPLQYFPVQANNSSPTEYLELRVTKNHGHPRYTCLYRFRVHGKRVDSRWPASDGS